MVKDMSIMPYADQNVLLQLFKEEKIRMCSNCKMKTEVEETGKWLQDFIKKYDGKPDESLARENQFLKSKIDSLNMQIKNLKEILVEERKSHLEIVKKYDKDNKKLKADLKRMEKQMNGIRRQ